MRRTKTKIAITLITTNLLSACAGRLTCDWLTAEEQDQQLLDTYLTDEYLKSRIKEWAENYETTINE